MLRTSSDHAVVFLDDTGRVVGWLGAAERLFGYSAAEARTLDFGVLFTADDRRLGLHRQEMAVARDSLRSEDDRWHVRKDGSLFWGSGLLEAVRAPDGDVLAYCKLVRDRTDIRTQLDALQNRLHSRQEQDERRSRHVLSLGHELRNALGALQNATALLTQSNDSGRREKSLDVLQRQLATMRTVLDDLSRISEIDRSGPRLNIEAVVVQNALESAVDSVRETARNKGQALILTASPVPFPVEADASRLQQMLLNLLGNALKYTPAGGQINISATIENDQVVIRITDDGIGISSSCLPRIFALFTRGEGAGSTPGMGVGLAVVRDLAAMHGGSVEARSPGEGKGSVFALRLPLRQAAPSGRSQLRRRKDDLP